MNVQRTVRAYGRAGAAAVLIEDKITPRALTAAGKPCLPRDEARMKIRAAVEAAKESGILVLARTDCRPTQGIDEAVARIAMYVEEGARSEEHTSELPSLLRISYAVFCLTKQNKHQ